MGGGAGENSSGRVSNVGIVVETTMCENNPGVITKPEDKPVLAGKNTMEAVGLASILNTAIVLQGFQCSALSGAVSLLE